MNAQKRIDQKCAEKSNKYPPQTQEEIDLKVEAYENHLKRIGEYENYMEFLENQDLQ